MHRTPVYVGAARYRNYRSSSQDIHITHCSIDGGMSKFTTAVTAFTSIPRETTSVATNTCTKPWRKPSTCGIKEVKGDAESRRMQGRVHLSSLSHPLTPKSPPHSASATLRYPDFPTRQLRTHLSHHTVGSLSLWKNMPYSLSSRHIQSGSISGGAYCGWSEEAEEALQDVCPAMSAKKQKDRTQSVATSRLAPVHTQAHRQGGGTHCQPSNTHARTDR